jgi:hypothetical protein
MNDNENDDDKRIGGAIADQGSSNDNTPSGPILALLTEFAREEKISEIAKAFIRFRAKYGANAGFVKEAIPAKILNWFFMKGDVISFSTFETWTKSHNDWAMEIKLALDNPQKFESVVKSMRDDLAAFEKSHAA